MYVTTLWAVNKFVFVAVAFQMNCICVLECIVVLDAIPVKMSLIKSVVSRGKLKHKEILSRVNQISFNFVMANVHLK
jgi:hypothetical protein